MKKWFFDNIIQLLTAIILVTFGYANFIKNVEANAENISKLEKRVDDYESKTDDKLDKAIKLLERIDERTKRL